MPSLVCSTRTRFRQLSCRVLLNPAHRSGIYRAGEKSMRRFQYKILDVFTREPLAGNMLAVFTDARGLTDAEMQKLAKETNLSETTFILPREKDVEAKTGVKVRIFTVNEELEFAGHPTLGTANVLRTNGQKQVDLDL